jgi:hypothetical protein
VAYPEIDIVEIWRDLLATERVKFLRNQRAEKRKELDRAMKRLEEFKAKHVGTLPEDVVDNRMQADRLTAEITNYQRDQRMLRENIDALNRDLVQLHVQIQAYEEQRPMRAEDAITETKRILSGLRLERDRLLLTYQEDNLIVVQHRKYIEKVELRLTELQNEEKTATERTQVDYFKYLQDETRKQIARREEEIENLNVVIDDRTRKVEEAQARILAAGTLESQYLSLERDIKDYEADYGAISAAETAADNMAAALRHDPGAGVPLQIEQQAFVPAKPASPDRLVTSALGLVIGLAIGIALAVTRHRLDASYQQADDLRALMPGAVLVTIPEVQTSGVRVGRALAGIFGGLVLTAIFAATVGILGVQLGWWGDMSMIQPLVDLR